MTQDKINEAIGLISTAQHRMNQAWKQSYSDLVDASNILMEMKLDRSKGDKP